MAGYYEVALLHPPSGRGSLAHEKKQINFSSKRAYSTNAQQVDSLRSQKIPNTDTLNPWALTGFIDGEGSFTIGISENKNKVVGSTHSPLNPWFVTGFSDAEGCFWIGLYKDNKYKTGWRVKLFFQINLHKKDLALLEQIQSYFNGIGKIYNKPLVVSYHVTSVDDLQIIIDHFDIYTLLTQKGADFELFKQAFVLIKNKEHLTDEGLEKIVAIKSSINNGLSDSLKDSFPRIVPVEKHKVATPITFDANWLAGFTSGDGCFMGKVFKSAKSKYGKTVQLVFQLSQHERDLELLNSIVKYFNWHSMCGSTVCNLIRKSIVGWQGPGFRFANSTGSLMHLNSWAMWCVQRDGRKCPSSYSFHYEDAMAWSSSSSI